MTRKTKGRDRLHGEAQKNTDSFNYTEIDPVAGWFSLAKSSRIFRKPKRGWQKGARK